MYQTGKQLVELPWRVVKLIRAIGRDPALSAMREVIPNMTVTPADDHEPLVRVGMWHHQVGTADIVSLTTQGPEAQLV